MKRLAKPGAILNGAGVRTRLSICARKRRYGSAAEAVAAARLADLPLFPYRCDRGAHYHLTSRTKGRRMSATGG